jgi:hypothetical protein
LTAVPSYHVSTWILREPVPHYRRWDLDLERRPRRDLPDPPVRRQGTDGSGTWFSEGLSPESDAAPKTGGGSERDDAFTAGHGGADEVTMVVARSSPVSASSATPTARMTA